jgi:hypothetical protein
VDRQSITTRFPPYLTTPTKALQAGLLSWLVMTLALGASADNRNDIGENQERLFKVKD